MAVINRNDGNTFDKRSWPRLINRASKLGWVTRSGVCLCSFRAGYTSYSSRLRKYESVGLIGLP